MTKFETEKWPKAGYLLVAISLIRNTWQVKIIISCTNWPKAGAEDPALGQMSNFLEALFIGNNINTNLNKNFHTYLNYHSFKPLFLCFQISARSSLKKFETEK